MCYFNLSRFVVVHGGNVKKIASNFQQVRMRQPCKNGKTNKEE
jgi:hypothetical protein